MLGFTEETHCSITLVTLGLQEKCIEPWSWQECLTLQAKKGILSGQVLALQENCTEPSSSQASILTGMPSFAVQSC